MRLLAPLLAMLLTPAFGLAKGGPAPDADPSRYDVVWSSASADSSGSMPLGNGDIGVNVWVEPGGDLVFYVSKTDAWNENGRLLKLGRVRVRLSPALPAGESFRQRLCLRDGEVTIAAGRGRDAMRLALWVDAHAPVVRVQMDSYVPRRAQASVELWRTRRRVLEGRELFSAYGLAGSPDPVLEHPDRLLPPRGRRIVWLHRNPTSIWRSSLELQGMGAWTRRTRDPLLHRAFGGSLGGVGMVPRGPASIATVRPLRRTVISVHALTRANTTEAAWAAALDAVVRSSDRVPLAEAQRRHRAWWRSFWARSWVHARGPVGAPPMTTPEIPLRIGADPHGGNGFRGTIARASVWARALSPAEIARLARDRHAPLPESRGLLAAWRFDGEPGRVPSGLEARLSGGARRREGPDAGLELDGSGWAEVAADGRLALRRACTLEAWVHPAELAAGGGRIIDRSLPGTSEGYLLDTYPSHSLRMIVSAGTLVHDAKLPEGRWAHVAATFDASTGVQRLYVDGAMVREQILGGNAKTVSRGYALQRAMLACAGRGGSPIKFNGSIYTVDAREPDERFGADYRRWGGPYWFQNTRLAYWPMLPAGDLEMLEPLFRMYMDALPFATERTRAYFGHEGAFFPETMTFWGSYANENYGWDRRGKPISHVDNTYIRWYWTGGLELIAMMVERWRQAPDERFLREHLLPLARPVLAFYDRHFPRDGSGKLRIEPGQALETWQQAVNPTPDVAGLRHVLTGLIALGEKRAGASSIAAWRRLLRETPPVPTEGPPGQERIAVAERTLAPPANVENPELYAVFPFRLFGVGLPGLELGRRAYAAKRFSGHEGWRQEEIHAACLGLAEEASRGLAIRFSRSHPGSRFPAFWGPNYDWVPDQDHGSAGMIAVQNMLLQPRGDRILLFAGWPRTWDVRFRLHGPRRTVVEAEMRGGRVTLVRVTPASRAKDVTVAAPD